MRAMTLYTTSSGALETDSVVIHLDSTYRANLRSHLLYSRPPATATTPA